MRDRKAMGLDGMPGGVQKYKEKEIEQIKKICGRMWKKKEMPTG